MTFLKSYDILLVKSIIKQQVIEMIFCYFSILLWFYYSLCLVSISLYLDILQAQVLHYWILFIKHLEELNKFTIPSNDALLGLVISVALIFMLGGN